jgi:DNA-binding response OmpR family regulator
MKRRILVVDDEVGFTRLLKLNLEQTRRYEVCVANWAEDALPLARRFRPDLVLLDVIMPRMFGGDVAARLRADRTLQKTPIVFLTAAVTKTRVKEHDGMISGFPFLAKPASVEEVINQIEQRLRQVPGMDSNSASELARDSWQKDPEPALPGEAKGLSL